jgi:hypothetical protein
MSVLEIERADGIMVLRMNRPERLNALNPELRGAWPRRGRNFATAAISRSRSSPGQGGAFAPART